MKTNVLYIQTFGDFKLMYNKKELSGNTVRSKQLWNLLEFLIANRYNDCSQERLYEVLWSGKELESHSNALKNLSYRLRTLLNKELGIDATKYIINKHGSYSWNINSKYILDIDEFENLIKTAKASNHNEKEAMLYYKAAIDLYQGDFLPEAIYKDWSVPIRVYYQNQFMKISNELSRYFLSNSEFIKAESIALKSIGYDKFVEENHRNLLQAYIGQNKYKKALEHYYNIVDMYLNEFGDKPSEMITDIYETIAAKDDTYSNNINEIKKELQESSVEGTMFVNYEAFKAIYRFKNRALKREPMSMFLTVVTVKFKDYVKVTDEKEKQLIDDISKLICQYLRKNDVVSICGKMQFAIILSNITYENTIYVLKRLADGLKKDIKYNNFDIYTQIDKMEA